MKDEAGFDTGDLYDAENHLVARVNGDLNVSIVYDHDGNRVAKRRVNLGDSSEQVTHYILDDRNPTGYMQVLAEYTTGTGASTPMVTYAYGLDLISQTASSTTHYYGYDGQGSVRMLLDTAVDGNTAITDTYDFDAYGMLLQREVRQNGVLVVQDDPSLPTGTPNHYLYTGEQWDSDLGMYFLRARYYNPEIGRFWTMDSYEGNNEDPQSLHKYLYCKADPVDNEDPLGLYTQEEGNALHTIIGADYALEHPKDSNVTYGRVAHIGKNPLLKPDILNKDQKTYAEIKPLTVKEISDGFAQLRKYGDSLGHLNYKTDMWPCSTFPPIRLVYYNWSPYFYFNVDGLILYTSVDPSLFFIPVGKPITKEVAKELAKKSARRLTTRGATTLARVVGQRAVGVALANSASIGSVTGVASVNSAMGAP